MKKYIISLLFITGSIIATGCQSTTPANNNTDQATNTETSSEVDINTWDVYESENYPLAVTHPADWLVLDIPGFECMELISPERNLYMDRWVIENGDPTLFGDEAPSTWDMEICVTDDDYTVSTSDTVIDTEVLQEIEDSIEY